MTPEKRNLKVIHANLDPAVVRFGELDADAQGEFKDAVDQFTRAYAFLAQVMPFTDPALEQLYVYVKALRTLLRDAATGGLDLGDDLVLTHLRLISHDAADIELEPGEIDPGTALPGGGHGGDAEPKRDSLTEIIAAINERFGTDLDERDRLEVEKVEITLQGDDELRTFANANTLESYALEFSPKFTSAILDTESHTQRLYNLLLTNPDLTKVIESELMRTTYRAMRAGDEAGTDDVGGGDRSG